MSEIIVKEFLESGVHFGHRASRWNPKMRPYIYARRNQIHIIDLNETLRGLIRAKKYLQKVRLVVASDKPDVQRAAAEDQATLAYDEAAGIVKEAIAGPQFELGY